MRTYVFIFSLVAALFSCSSNDDSVNNNSIDNDFEEIAYADVIHDFSNQTVDETYDYPILPGSDAWYELDSYGKRSEACTVPSSWASQASTKGLILSFLLNPMASYTLYYDNPFISFKRMLCSEFGKNLFSELQKRDDFVNCWEIVYSDFIKVYENNLHMQCSLDHLHYFISVPELLDEMTLEQKKLLTGCILKTDVGNNASLEIALCNLMISAGFGPMMKTVDTLPEYSATWEGFLGPILNFRDIAEMANEFINE